VRLVIIDWSRFPFRRELRQRVSVECPGVLGMVTGKDCRVSNTGGGRRVSGWRAAARLACRDGVEVKPESRLVFQAVALARFRDAAVVVAVDRWPEIGRSTPRAALVVVAGVPLMVRGIHPVFRLLSLVSRRPVLFTTRPLMDKRTRQACQGRLQPQAPRAQQLSTRLP